MWNIKDVYVGYNKEMAKQFKLEGRHTKDPIDLLPKLSVDSEIPYSLGGSNTTRRPSHLPNHPKHAQLSINTASVMAASYFDDAVINIREDGAGITTGRPV